MKAETSSLQRSIANFSLKMKFLEVQLCKKPLKLLVSPNGLFFHLFSALSGTEGKLGTVYGIWQSGASDIIWASLFLSVTSSSAANRIPF